jgi:hypothetical protein
MMTLLACLDVSLQSGVFLYTIRTEKIFEFSPSLGTQDGKEFCPRFL